MKKRALNILGVLLLVIAAPFTQTNAQTPVIAPANDSGNGGGGVYRNGRYMTFYTAGVYVETDSRDVPQLNELQKLINTNAYLNNVLKSKYISAIMPSINRQYYKVSANSFTPELRARLIEEYGRVTGIHQSELALFAITDTNSGNTYLFPEYYKLAPIEQKAILFHEAYWLVNPSHTYEEVVRAEISFQSYLSNPGSADHFLRWTEVLGTKKEALLAAIKYDISTKSLKGLINKDYSIDLHDIFGKKWVHCLNSDVKALKCRPLITTNIYSLTMKYPNSLFLKILYRQSASGKLAYGEDWIGTNRIKDVTQNVYDKCDRRSLGGNVKVYLLDDYFKGYSLKTNLKKHRKCYEIEDSILFFGQQ